jgi:hypothetical protein
LRDQENDDDGLPDIGMALSANALSKTPSFLVGSTAEDPIDVEDDMSDGADEHLEIPGEGVLAKDRSDAKYWWPAKILEYVPKSRYKRIGKKKGMYKIEFMDRREKVVSREWFYASHEDAFATCQVGHQPYLTLYLGIDSYFS